MINVLIIDDEEQGRHAVSHIISNYPNDITIVGFADGVADAIEKINRLKPDLLLLDVNLGDGTGFDVLKTLQNPPKTIFITAYDNYAIQAFKFNALDYILKPFDANELLVAIERYTNSLQYEQTNLPEKQVKNYKSGDPEKLIVQSFKGFEMLSIKDIYYLEADNNYTTFVLNNRRILVSKTLKYFEEMLSDLGFFRSHQSFLIQLNQIQEFTKQSINSIKMKNGDIVEVSRRKKDELTKIMKDTFLH